MGNNNSVAADATSPTEGDRSSKRGSVEDPKDAKVSTWAPRKQVNMNVIPISPIFLFWQSLVTVNVRHLG